MGQPEQTEGARQAEQLAAEAERQEAAKELEQIRENTVRYKLGELSFKPGRLPENEAEEKGSAS